MPKGYRGVALRELDHLFASGTVVGLSDGELLQRFADDRDELAFTALVERHGPMVLSVCRRILRNRHQADDVFQAAFLILVQKAGSIHVDDSLGRWLYRVTRRLALRADADTDRRQRFESLATIPILDQCGNDAERRETALAIHEELCRLPKIYRNVVMLCYLEGLTHQEAARKLHWPLGSVKGRLVRARELLRIRLTRRGVVVSSGALAITLRPAAVSALLLEQTLTAAIGFAAGRAGMIPAVTLANGVLTTMFLSKLKLVATALAVCLVTYATGIAVGDGPGDSTPKTATTKPGVPQPASKIDQKFQVVSDGKDRDRLEDNLTTLEVRKAKLEVYLANRESDLVGAEAEEARAKAALLQSQRNSEKARLEVKRVSDEINQIVKDHHRILSLATPPLESKRATASVKGKPLPEKMQPLGIAREGAMKVMSSYPVAPPDMLQVDVFEALPGRPIKGEFLVRPDGKISLGFYGEVYVAGLTPEEIKEKVILQLRKHLPDTALGLKSSKDETIPPRDSNRVSVNVTSYNSSVYYVQGSVGSAGRLPITGNETVLDAISYAGGVLPSASEVGIRLIRPASEPGGQEQVLPVNLQAIIEKGDTTTNYQIFPQDRLIVSRREVSTANPSKPQATETGVTRSEVETRIDALIKELGDLKRELGK